MAAATEAPAGDGVTSAETASGVRSTMSRPQKAVAAARQVLARTAPGLVIYNSFVGQYSDNPRAIYEELRRRQAPLQHVWLADPTRVFPDDAARVQRGTTAYFRTLGRAEFIVSNNAMPQLLPKPRIRYLQTWHGTPLKKLGYDNPRRLQDMAGLRHAARDYRQWDFLISQNPFSTSAFRTAFRYEGEILETGYPRNDVLSSPDAAAIRRATRERLDIPVGATVVLYAPTFRDGQYDDRGRVSFDLALDLDRLHDALGDEVVILLRLHYSITELAVHERPRRHVRHVSRYGDIRDLYLAADAMVTDYSSTMFDFAVTGKPMVLFTYDLEHYRDSLRGHYFDITERAPGPLCRTNDDVIEALKGLSDVEREYAGKYAAFRAEFCPFDDGHAAARVVDRVFGADDRR